MPGHIQLELDQETYKSANKIAEIENDRRGLFKRSEKVHYKNIVPILVGWGVKFHNHEIYIPEDVQKELMKNDKFSRLYAKAQVAMSELHEEMQKHLQPAMAQKST